MCRLELLVFLIELDVKILRPERQGGWLGKVVAHLPDLGVSSIL